MGKILIDVGMYWKNLHHACYPSGRQCALLGTLGLAVLVSGCAPNLHDADEELQIQQAVLRYQFEHNAAADKYSIFCVAIGQGDGAVDAPMKLIRGVNDVNHKVLKASDCNENQGNGVTERASGKPALMLNVGQVSWLTKDEAVVKGGYYEASLSASGNTYRLKKLSGLWRVMKDEMNWIS